MAAVDTERFTVAMITHAPPGDAFWDKIRGGAEDAAGALNIELNYSGLQQGQGGPEQATLVQNAIDQGVDGFAVTLAYPGRRRPGGPGRRPRPGSRRSRSTPASTSTRTTAS